MHAARKPKEGRPGWLGGGEVEDDAAVRCGRSQRFGESGCPEGTAWEARVRQQTACDALPEARRRAKRLSELSLQQQSSRQTT